MKNATQLPIPQNKLGLRLPPDRHCLTNTNYKLKGKNKPSGFDYGTLKHNYRGKKGQTNRNENPCNFSVGNSTGNQLPLLANDTMGNNGSVVTGQPVFKSRCRSRGRERTMTMTNLRILILLLLMTMNTCTLRFLVLLYFLPAIPLYLYR